MISNDDLAPNRPQIRIWYGIFTWINQFTAIDLNVLVKNNLAPAMHFNFFVIFWFFFAKIALLCSFIIDTLFVLHIIHRNNAVSKSLRPWFLRNRSYRRRAPCYRRHAPSYRSHPIKLPSSVISDKLAYRRLAANLSEIIVQKREMVRVCRFGARCTMPPCYSVANLREIGGRKEAQAGKNFSKRAAARAPSWRR